jgi:BirA family transcriptional regulator, biotin operon repressor / biotin---[acetyl-CoA-carboxylase] ligase
VVVMMVCVPETGSTNADLAVRLRGGEAVLEGTWLVADRQSAGRGRQGREWLDGAGNFMGSTVVHPLFGDPPAATLALLAGLAVFEAVLPHVALPHRAMLKWPNDVLVGHAKLAGILLERVGEVVVIGFGVNLVSAPLVPDREAVALSAFGPPPERNAFAEALARQFAVELGRWRTYGIESIVNRWLAVGHPLGTRLKVEDFALDSPFVTFHGLTPEGALQLRLADGSVRTIHGGEVNLAD